MSRTTSTSTVRTSTEHTLVAHTLNVCITLGHALKLDTHTCIVDRSSDKVDYVRENWSVLHIGGPTCCCAAHANSRAGKRVLTKSGIAQQESVP